MVKHSKAIQTTPKKIAFIKKKFFKKITIETPKLKDKKKPNNTVIYLPIFKNDKKNKIASKIKIFKSFKKKKPI